MDKKLHGDAGFFVGVTSGKGLMCATGGVAKSVRVNAFLPKKKSGFSGKVEKSS